MYKTFLSTTDTPSRYDEPQNAAVVLQNLRKCDLAGGAYDRPEDGRGGHVQIAHTHLLSTYNIGKDRDLGLGYVKALLAVASGYVVEATMTPAGDIGQAVLRSLTGSGRQDRQWQATKIAGMDALLMGPFPRGGNFTAAVLAFLALYGAGADELTQRWGAFITALDRLCPRREGVHGLAWSTAQIVMSCQPGAHTSKVRHALEAVADSLRHSYAHHETERIGPYVHFDPLDRTGWPALSRTLSLADLLQPVVPTARFSPSGVAPPAPGAGDDEDEVADLSLDIENEPTSPAPRMAAPPTPSARPMGHTAVPLSSAPPTHLVLDVGAYETIRSGVFRPGAYFVFGGTANGKSALIEQATYEWLLASPGGPGHLDVIRFNPGIRSDLVLGANLPMPLVDPTTGTTTQGFRWVDGPATRVFRFIAETGRRGVLFMDEVTRAHPSIVALFMAWIETTRRAVVEAMGLRITRPDPGDEYHVIRIDENQEVFVLPASLLKIVGAANIGDSYQQSVRLDDPAFRRRWKAGWREIRALERKDAARVLSLRLAIPADHQLIQALLSTHQAICEYQHKEDALVMTTNLDLLITWGRECLRRASAKKDEAAAALTPTDTGSPRAFRSRAEAMKAADPAVHLADVFVPAAQDLWLDAICPIKGDATDTDVMKSLIDLVTMNRPRGGI